MGVGALLERIVLRHGALLLAAVALASAVLALGYARLRWTGDPEVITLEGSDELDFYRAFVARWGSDKWIVLAYEVDDAFSNANLARLRELTGALQDVPGVASVASLDTAAEVDTGPFGPYVRPLVPDELGSDPGLRETALANGFVRDQLVSHDGRLVLVAVQLEASELDSTTQEREVLAAVDATLTAPEFASLRVHRAGSPVFNRELERLNRRDNALFTPLALAMIAGVLALLFRSALATGLALGTIGLTVLWTQGLMGWLGVPMNITTSLLPPLLMVIAVAYAIHVISGYVERLGEGRSREQALRWTLEEMLPSCFWTAATTAIGFASLLTVRIESVRVFGAFSMLGVAIAFLLCAGVLPALLVRLPLEGVAERRAELAWLRFVTAGARRRWPALCFLALVLGLGVWGAPRVEVATHDGEFFTSENPINQAYRLIESRIGGVTPFEVELQADAPGAFRTAAGVRLLDALQRRLAEVPELSAGTSLVDLLRASNPGLALDDADAVKSELFLLEALEPTEVGRFVRDDGRLARISARADAMTSARSEAILRELRADASRLAPAGHRVRFTGLVPVFAQMEQYLVTGQLASYGSAIALVAAVFLLLHRSLRVTAVALLVNVAPIGPTAAAMAWFAVRLDVATIMVASIALGIVVDDTIHVLHAWRRGLELRGDAEGALEYALGVAGRPTILTAAILVGGFGMLALSDFQPTAHFGALVAFTVAVALAVELVVLPPALDWLAPRFLAVERANPGTGVIPSRAP
ncbi:MAG: MMPL family transporter [Myxococcota bacterium]